MAQLLSASFGSGNQGLQVGQSYGTINAEFHLPPERSETPPLPFAAIPFRRDPDFVNRGDILDHIDRVCSEPAGRVALVGLGGVGKSQLAIEFAHRIVERPADTWVFWIHASTQARVEEGFATIAEMVKLPSRNQPKANIPQLVSTWLSNERHGDWIMIIDSADDLDILCGKTRNTDDGRPLATYLPQSRNGSIILTTRDRDLAFRLTGNHQNIIGVGPMTETDALRLLENRLGSVSDMATAIDLVRALDLVPLAISQAAAYIQTRARSSLENYLAEFRGSERKRLRLLKHDAGDLRREGGASNAILTTWQVSFDHIHFKKPSAANLLSLMSFFNPQGIPERLLKASRYTQDVTQASSPNDTTGSGSNSGDSTTDDNFEDDVATLTAFCLITMTEEDTFEMHGLVQLSTRKWLETHGQQETFKHQYIKLMADSFPSAEYENWGTCQRLFPHVEVALECRPTNDGYKLPWANLLYSGGGYALEQGMYDVAERMLHQAIRTAENRVGKEGEVTLDSTALLSIVLFSKGLYREAETLQVQGLETWRIKLGVDHPNTLTSMSNLATTLYAQSRYEEAEKLQVEGLETRRIQFGVNHPDTLTSMHNLASTLYAQRRYEEAEKLQVEVLETRRIQLGVDHPKTLTSMSNLAMTLHAQRRYEEAEKLQVEALETRRIQLGVNHPDMLTSMHNLASTLYAQRRYEEAEKLQVEVLETRRIQLGVDHPDTLTSMNNLARIWMHQGQHEKALVLMTNCAQALQRVLGSEHPHTLNSSTCVERWSK